MVEFARVEPEAEAALEALADAVVATLGAVGLPASRSEAADFDAAGFEVEVDLGADEAGGVFVSWQAPGELEDRASELCG